MGGNRRLRQRGYLGLDGRRCDTNELCSRLLSTPWLRKSSQRVRLMQPMRSVRKARAAHLMCARLINEA